MPAPKKEDARLLGKLEAESNHHKESITELKGRLNQAEDNLRTAMKEWHEAVKKYRNETNKTLWLRRGFIFCLSSLFALYAWLVVWDRPIVKDVIKWLLKQLQRN